MCMLTPFLQYVVEGRVVRRQSDLSRYTFQEICEKIYLSFLTLALLKNFGSTRKFAKSYTAQTLTYGTFDRVRSTANDLHNMLAVVAGDPSITDKLSNKNVAGALRQRQVVPLLAVKKYLRTLENDYTFLSNLESSLGISNSDYKNLRRAISDFIDLDSSRKKMTTTRLLQALRAKLPGTDLQKQTQIFADKYDLELDKVVDAELTVPGVKMGPEEMNAYRVLVGAQNVRRAKMAADLAMQGRSIPGPIVASYAPIIKMIDDIAKGGYTFIRLLQTIHARAKKINRR